MYRESTHSTAATPRRLGRDVIIGYVDQLKQYGYPEERLVPCPMIVNTDIFHPQLKIPDRCPEF